MSAKKFNIRGKTYDLDDAADLVSIQNALVPENWPGKKPDCVRNFIATQEMLALQLRRHLAANFKVLAKTAREEMEDGGVGKVKVSFTFEIDQTSPMVVAISGIALGFSVRHGSKTKPVTFDLTQSQLPFEGDDMTAVFDTKATAEESSAPPEPDDTKGDVEKFPPPEGSSTPPEPGTEEASPPKRGRGKGKK